MAPPPLPPSPPHHLALRRLFSCLLVLAGTGLAAPVQAEAGKLLGSVARLESELLANLGRDGEGTRGPLLRPGTSSSSSGSSSEAERSSLSPQPPGGHQWHTRPSDLAAGLPGPDTSSSSPRPPQGAPREAGAGAQLGGPASAARCSTAGPGTLETLAWTPRPDAAHHGRRHQCPPERAAVFRELKLHSVSPEPPVDVQAWYAWDPPEDKYLVMECSYGGVSNRIRCILNHLKVAGLLNRTLIVDDLQLDWTGSHYSWPLLMDFAHLRRCFGPRAVMGTREYMETHGGQKLQVDALLCVSGVCANIDWAWWNHTIGVPPETQRQRLPCCRSAAEMINLFKNNFTNIRGFFLGDLAVGFYGIGAWNRPLIFPSALTDLPFPRRPGCPNNATVLPHSELLCRAKAFVAKTFPGQPFVSVHWRKGDFAGMCKSTPSACIPLHQVVDCIVREAAAVDASAVLVCSDGSEALMQNLTQAVSIATNGKLFVVTSPEPENLPQALIGLHREGYSGFQKLVMAMGTVFLGTNASTFSEDVERLRLGLGYAHCRDTYIYAQEAKSPQKILRIP